ncbi:Membrane magnesium transporter 1 [Chytriomyces hyalinus]|nr:Membrane magnesium transporter 1 [Chytriomyces hyalinus]
MALNQVGGFILAASLALIAHSGYSAVEHISFAKTTHAGASMPIDITAECLIGLLGSIFGVVLFAGDLREIKMDREMSTRSVDVLAMTPSFKTIRHRGAALFKQNK